MCPAVGGTCVQQTYLCRWKPVSATPEAMAPLLEMLCQVPRTPSGQRRGHAFPQRCQSSSGSCSQELTPCQCRVCWGRETVGAVVLGRAVAVMRATLSTRTASCLLGAILSVPCRENKGSSDWGEERVSFSLIVCVLFILNTVISARKFVLASSTEVKFPDVRLFCP